MPPGKYIVCEHSLLKRNPKRFYLHRHSSATNIQNTDDDDDDDDDDDCTFQQRVRFGKRKRSVREVRHVASDLAPILGPFFGPVLGSSFVRKGGWMGMSG